MKLDQLLSSEDLKIFSRRLSTSETPLWHYWPEFVDNYLITGRSEVTVKNVRDVLQLLIRKLDILTVEQVNNPRKLEKTLLEYKRDNNLSNSTYNSYLKNINTFFMWLLRMEYIQENKVTKVQKCVEKPSEQLTLNDASVRLIVEHVKIREQTELERHRNVLFITFLRFTGARPSELLDIRLQDIFLDKNVYKLAIRGKKQKGRVRYYRLPAFVVDDYLIYLNYRSDYSESYQEKLFISRVVSKPWTYNGVKKLFSNISKELKMRLTPYQFRRYVPTKLYTEGMSLDKIGNYLGHTRPSTTQRYIERSCALTNDCSDVLSKFDSQSVV